MEVAKHVGDTEKRRDVDVREEETGNSQRDRSSYTRGHVQLSSFVACESSNRGGITSCDPYHNLDVASITNDIRVGEVSLYAVSYTHLTLPTIYSV